MNDVCGHVVMLTCPFSVSAASGFHQCGGRMRCLPTLFLQNKEDGDDASSISSVSTTEEEAAVAQVWAWEAIFIGHHIKGIFRVNLPK